MNLNRAGFEFWLASKSVHVTISAGWHLGRAEPDLAGCGRYRTVLCRWPWPTAPLLPSRLLAGRRGCYHAWPCLDATLLHCLVSWHHASTARVVPCAHSCPCDGPLHPSTICHAMSLDDCRCRRAMVAWPSHAVGDVSLPHRAPGCMPLPLRDGRLAPTPVSRRAPLRCCPASRRQRDCSGLTPPTQHVTLGFPVSSSVLRCSCCCYRPALAWF